MQRDFGWMCVAVMCITGCATPPKSNRSLVESGCAQQCSTSLSTCSAGFKAFPVVQQKQCNNNYDVCIGGCPTRIESPVGAGATVAERLKRLDDLLKAGTITQAEYDTKRKEIVGSL